MRIVRMRSGIAACMVLLAASACTHKTVANRKLDAQSVSVGIMALEYPKLVLANSEFVVDIAIRNTGGVSIPSQPARPDGALRVNASYHWKTTDHRVVVWDGLLTPLDSDLDPGTDQELQLKVKAPPSPGAYVLDIDLVQSGAFWFEGVGSQTATMTIEVR